MAEELKVKYIRGNLRIYRVGRVTDQPRVKQSWHLLNGPKLKRLLNASVVQGELEDYDEEF